MHKIRQSQLRSVNFDSDEYPDPWLYPHRTLTLIHQSNGLVLKFLVKIPVLLSLHHNTPPSSF